MNIPTFPNAQINLLKDKVNHAGHIVLIGHVNPDGDAIGSLLGLYHTLRQVTTDSCTIQMLAPTPGNRSQLEFLDNINLIITHSENPQDCIGAIQQADTIICVDFNNTNRIDALQEHLLQSNAYKILIDHHHHPETEQFDLVFSMPEISATCELLYWIISTTWGEQVITQQVATALYCGICTDTGTFSYSNTHPSLYMATAALVARHIHPDRLQIQLFNNFSVARMQFYGFAINNRLRIFPEKKFAYFYITIDDRKQFGIDKSDLEGLVNYTLLMHDIQVGVLIREEPDKCKLSFRSKFGIEVHTVAQRLFNGGGHTQAAGATSTLSLEETIKVIEREYLEK